MAEWHRMAMFALATASAICAGGSAMARVQEYQIVRLITFKSECQIDKLVERSAATGPLRFLATCENVSFYPDGVEVVCDDRDDDRSCRVLTSPKSFDSLDLLRR